jgi:hypothetical protein
VQSPAFKPWYCQREEEETEKKETNFLKESGMVCVCSGNIMYSCMKMEK